MGLHELNYAKLHRINWLWVFVTVNVNSRFSWIYHVIYECRSTDSFNFIELICRGGQQQQQQGQPPPPTQSWYPPSVASPTYSAPSRSPPPLPQTSGVNPLSRQNTSDARANSGVYPPSNSTGSYSGGHHPPTSLPASSSGSYSSSPVSSNSVASLKDKRWVFFCRNGMLLLLSECICKVLTIFVNYDDLERNV